MQSERKTGIESKNVLKFISGADDVHAFPDFPSEASAFRHTAIGKDISKKKRRDNSGDTLAGPLNPVVRTVAVTRIGCVHRKPIRLLKLDSAAFIRPRPRE